MDEERLILEVEKHKILYSPAHPFYKDNVRKERAWKEVAAVFGLEADICKTKWKALRDGFVKNRRRSQQPSGSAGGIQRDWKYSEIMSFILPFVQPRSSRSNLDNGVEESGGTTTSLSERPSPCSASDSTLMSDVRESPQRPRSPRERHHTPSAPGKNAAGKFQKLPTDDLSERLLSLLGEPTPTSAPLIPRDPTEESYHFLVSLVPALSGLDKKRRREAKFGILKLLGDLEDRQAQDVPIAPHHPPRRAQRQTHTQRGASSFHAEGWDHLNTVNYEDL